MSFSTPRSCVYSANATTWSRGTSIDGGAIGSLGRRLFPPLANRQRIELRILAAKRQRRLRTDIGSHGSCRPAPNKQRDQFQKDTTRKIHGIDFMMRRESNLNRLNPDAAAAAERIFPTIT